MTFAERLQRFFSHDTAGGIMLLLAAVLALVLANSPLNGIYNLLLDTPIAVAIGEFEIRKPILLWVNDGLMAVFFLLVGLELKREFLEGELSNVKNIVLPAVAALGGMLIPALIYAAINADDPITIQGWAIPAATDIAFALGILSLLGPRVPLAVKIFLTSVAIFDDIGAIIIIALFYTHDISFIALGVAAVCIFVLFAFNSSGVTSLRAYAVVGLVMWVALLKSSVHATLAGALLAMFIPITIPKEKKDSTHEFKRPSSPLKFLEHSLHAPVAFLVLPIFAFANAGVNVLGLSVAGMLHGVPLGIAAGLFVGKQVGVFVFSWVAIKLGIAKLPKAMTLPMLYGVSLLCGVGFTMSLFIGSLAFNESHMTYIFDERLGILVGSFVSAIGGYWVLSIACKKTDA